MPRSDGGYLEVCDWPRPFCTDGEESPGKSGAEKQADFFSCLQGNYLEFFALIVCTFEYGLMA